MSEEATPAEQPPPERSGLGGRLLTLLIVAVAAYNVVSWIGSQRRRTPELPIGGTAPTIHLPMLGGGEGVVGPTKGEVVLLDFWATWCLPCIKSMPELREVRERLEGKAVRLVLVNADGATPTRLGDVGDFLRTHAVELPVALDDGRAQAAFRVERLPYTVLLDRNGVVARRWKGVADAETIVRLVETLLEGP